MDLKSIAISIRVPNGAVIVLDEIADNRNIPMRTMLRGWVMERLKTEVATIMSERKCAFCHKTIPKGEEVYLDENSVVTFFCDNGVCGEAYICECVERVSAEVHSKHELMHTKRGA